MKIEIWGILEGRGRAMDVFYDGKWQMCRNKGKT